MPLLDNLPPIDDRRYDDLVAELRARIPRYTPEWTDLNDNDPGIALVQLFAWLGDMLLYRLGLVPELNHLKFLELLGIELEPAQPAVAEIQFPVAPGAPEAAVIVPRHTPVAVGSGGALVFETDRAIVALAAPLAAVQRFDGYGYHDLTADNAALAAPFEPFGQVAPVDSALVLGFGPAPLAPDDELDLAFVAEPGGTGAVSCAAPVAAAGGRLAWEVLDGAGHWRSLRLLDDATGGFERSGHVRLRTPAAGVAAVVGLGEVATPLAWIRARVVRAAYDRAPRLRSVRTNTAPATQAQTVVDEVVGGSDGRRDQVHRLANAPVLDGTLVLEISDGATTERWNVVGDLLGSGPDDRDVVLNRTTGDLRFGDGRHGAIPPGDPRNPNGNIVARTYRWGGGAAGRVGAGAISTLLRQVPGIDDSAVTNVAPSVGGRDEETLAEAKARAPQAIRSRTRAVTAGDFEHLATQVGTVRRACTLPFAHPDFPGVAVPGAVTVVVVPEPTAAAHGGLGPAPSQATLRAVCQALDRGRLVTCEVHVVAPVYHVVTVSADVVAEADADLAAVKTLAEAALATWFDPLTGGDDGLGWPFGGDIAFSRVYARLGVPGVARIDRVIIALDGDEAPECTNVPVPGGHLLVSGAHDVRPTYEVPS